MKISVVAKPNSKVEKVEALGEGADGSFNVFVKAPAREGLANEAMIAALAKHFGVAKKQVKLCLGGRGKYKVFEVDV
jgi:uncharacterized protein YggU (UPF0235/DUF167 family)